MLAYDILSKVVLNLKAFKMFVNLDAICVFFSGYLCFNYRHIFKLYRHNAPVKPTSKARTISIFFFSILYVCFYSVFFRWIIFKKSNKRIITNCIELSKLFLLCCMNFKLT